ncbi:DUF1127 domain-containing protein [Sulfitobacter sp. AS92]|uniref:DUF1127 domain-containing protein n=1 Tax=Sulfitobacter sp. AS92 TaxID=3135783 RepID=UPI00317AA90D
MSDPARPFGTGRLVLRIPRSSNLILMEHAMHFRLLKNTNQIAGMPGTAFAGGAMGQVAASEGLALVAMLRRALRDTLRRWERNRTLSTLNAMDDRLLQDIGLSRKDIPQHIRDMESFSRR